MKTVKNIFVALVLVAALMACRDKAAEKRIAELESRLAKVEESKKANPTVTEGITTTAAPVTEQKPDGPLPVMEFEKMEHDFGSVPEGQKVSYTYKLKNTGSAPLIIQSAQPSCGCTVPDWTREPIPVGGTGFVKAEFDTKNKAGANNKSITVTANTWPKTATLKFKATVTASAGPVK